MEERDDMEAVIQRAKQAALQEQRGTREDFVLDAFGFSQEGRSMWARPWPLVLVRRPIRTGPRLLLPLRIHT